ncbi:hypothetical protein SprV_0100259000 [Sparganum proliferum]
MFLERLPTSVQTILASGSDDLNILKLAEMADRMMEVERLSSPTIAQVSQPLTMSASDWGELKTQIAQLSATVAALQLRRSPGPSRRSFGRDDRRSRSRPRTANLSANCSPIPTFGSLSLTLNIGLRRSFTWIFVIADVPHGVLGLDFPAEFDLLVDCRSARLLDRTTGLFVRELTPFTTPTNLYVLDTDIASPFRFGVVINPSKCVLGVPSLEFLGHQVDSEGLRPLPSKVEAVRNFPPPTSKSRLQRSLGMVNFYRRFLPNCADLMFPFTNMLSGPKGPLDLTDDALTAFERIKNSLADATFLTHPAPKAQLSLMLLPAETRYSTFGRELLAIYLDVIHFRHFLEGRDFTVFTDHKPLTFAFRSHSDKLNPREIRQLDYISQFTSDIRNIDGTKNEVADALSRPSIAHLQLSPGIDLAEMAAKQRCVRPATDNWQRHHFMRCIHPLPSSIYATIPPPQIFSSLHNLSHPGSRATDKLVSNRFVWPGMHKDLKASTRACIACQRSKIQRHNKAPIGTFPGPGARFSHVHLDIVGHLPLSNGCSYLLTCVDRFTQWPEAIPLSDIAAPTVVKAFLSRWVAIFGATSTITTDRGVQFESNPFQSLPCFLGCTRIRTTAYHPTANGMVERFHRQLKASLRAAADPENSTDHLPLVLFGTRSVLKPDLDCSVAELVFGANVRLPGEMISLIPRGAVEDPTNLLRRLRQFMWTLSPVPPRCSASPSYLEKDLATCSHVFLRCDRLRRPLEPPHDGPFRVLSRVTKTFRIQRDNREEVGSVDRLKAAVPDTPPDEPSGAPPSAFPVQPLFHRPVFSLCSPVRYLRLPPPTPTLPPPDVFTLLRTLYISLAVVVMYTFLVGWSLIPFRSEHILRRRFRRPPVSAGVLCRGTRLSCLSLPVPHS